jgi:hypothetical protein
MSTAFRITQRSVSNTMLQGLQSNQGKLQQIQEQLSSGKQVSRPSDSPVKTVEDDAVPPPSCARTSSTSATPTTGWPCSTPPTPR